MHPLNLTLVDATGNAVAALTVTQEGERYTGTVRLDDAPPDLVKLFAEFEECVNGQMFAHADAVEERIAALGLKVLFPNGAEADAEELEVYPRTGRASVRARVPVKVPVQTR